MRDRVARSVIAAIQGLGEDLDLDALKSVDEDTRLYGAKSGLDSITLVTLIAEVEDRLEADFGQAPTLADERAMSRQRSPFRRVGSLIDHAAELLQEEAT